MSWFSNQFADTRPPAEAVPGMQLTGSYAWANPERTAFNINGMNDRTWYLRPEYAGQNVDPYVNMNAYAPQLGAYNAQYSTRSVQDPYVSLMYGNQADIPDYIKNLPPPATTQSTIEDIQKMIQALSPAYSNAGSEAMNQIGGNYMTPEQIRAAYQGGPAQLDFRAMLQNASNQIGRSAVASGTAQQRAMQEQLGMRGMEGGLSQDQANTIHAEAMRQQMAGQAELETQMAGLESTQRGQELMKFLAQAGAEVSTHTSKANAMSSAVLSTLEKLGGLQGQAMSAVPQLYALQGTQVEQPVNLAANFATYGNTLQQQGAASALSNQLNGYLNQILGLYMQGYGTETSTMQAAFNQINQLIQQFMKDKGQPQPQKQSGFSAMFGAGPVNVGYQG